MINVNLKEVAIALNMFISGYLFCSEQPLKEENKVKSLFMTLLVFTGVGYIIFAILIGLFEGASDKLKRMQIRTLFIYLFNRKFFRITDETYDSIYSKMCKDYIIADFKKNKTIEDRLELYALRLILKYNKLEIPTRFQLDGVNVSISTCLAEFHNENTFSSRGTEFLRFLVECGTEIDGVTKNVNNKSRIIVPILRINNVLGTKTLLDICGVASQCVRAGSLTAFPEPLHIPKDADIYTFDRSDYFTHHNPYEGNQLRSLNIRGEEELYALCHKYQNLKKGPTKTKRKEE